MKVLGLNIESKRQVAKRALELEELSKATKPKVPQRPIGLMGLKTASGKVEDEFLYELRWPQAGKVYQEMSSNDSIVGGCLFLIETIARQAQWQVKPASEDAGDVENAHFLETCMNDMQDQSWDDFISDALSMLTFGFSFHEIVYKVRRGPLEKDPKFKSNYTDGKFGWQELPIRAQSSLEEWVFDENTGKTLEFVQNAGESGGDPVHITLENNLLFRTKSNKGSPEGWSILRRAYRSWYFKRYIEELEGIGIERNLAGIPVLAPPVDVNLFDDKNDEMIAMLEWSQQLVNNLRQDKNHGVVLPNTDWELKLLGAEGSSKAMDTDTIIRRHETRIAMSMLADILILGGDRTGSFALSETKQGLFIQSLQAIVNSIANTLNSKAVPTLFAINNMTPEKLPEIVVEKLQTPSIKEVALLLRSFGTDVTQNQKLFNFLLGLIHAPQLNTTEYNAFMAAQVKASDTENNTDNDDFQDTATNDAKQSDESYM